MNDKTDVNIVGGHMNRNEAKFKLIQKRKNKLTSSHGGMIIQLRAAIFKRIRNVKIQTLQTGNRGFISG